MDMNLIDEIVSAVKNDKPEKNHTHSAIVSRIDDEGVVWVTITGSEIETPTAETSAEVKKGDRVNVDWRNNRLYISGNVSNPSAGVTRVSKVEDSALRALTAANSAEAAAASAQASAETAGAAASDAVSKAEEVHGIAEQAISDAATANASAELAKSEALNAKSNAERAKGDAVAANKAANEAGTAAAIAQAALESMGEFDEQMQYEAYFWHDSKGAHVLSNDSGSRMDLAGDGLEITNSNGESVATFGTEGSRIGRPDDAHMELSSGGMDLFQGDRLIAKYSQGLRIWDDSGQYEIAQFCYDKASKDGEIPMNKHPHFALGNGARRTPTDEWCIGANSICIGRNNAASAMNSIAVGQMNTIHRLAINAIAMGTLCTVRSEYGFAEGYKTQAGEIGLQCQAAHAEGNETAALGEAAHAEGNYTFAIGAHSHAEGSNTIAEYDEQHVQGRFNRNLEKNAFEIGNGTSDNARSNAFEVDWSGNVTAAGKVNGVDLSKTLQSGQDIQVGKVNGVDVEELSRKVSECPFPVNSIYMSLSAADPSSLWAGTVWERCATGRTLIGVDEEDADLATAGMTGGEKAHKLTSEESGLPAHGHGFTQPKIPNHTHSAGSGRAFVTNNGGGIVEHKVKSGNDTAYNYIYASDSSDNWYPATSTASSGGGGACTGGAVQNAAKQAAAAAHNNIPPYLTCYIWLRTA